MLMSTEHQGPYVLLIWDIIKISKQRSRSRLLKAYRHQMPIILFNKRKKPLTFDVK
jgi:hypothetical protein